MNISCLNLNISIGIYNDYRIINHVNHLQRSEAISFGADTYVATNNGWTKPIQPSLDVLIITITKSVDWKPYMDMMLPNAVMVFVGAITDKPLPLQIFGPFIAKQVLICNTE